MQSGEHPRLVFGGADVPALRAKAETPVGRAIVARLDALLARRPAAIDAGFHAAGHGLLWLLREDGREAARAARLVEKTITDHLKHPQATKRRREGKPVALWDSHYKAIVKTDPAVGVALAYDLCCGAWDEAFRRRVAAALDAKARELIRGGGIDWNASPYSNWHANTRSGAGLCALAVLGDEGAEHAQASLEAALRGVRDYFRTQAGDRGWTQEGFAYYRYPLTHHLLPFIQACRHTIRPDPLPSAPADWYALFYVQLLLPAPAFGFVPIVNGMGLWENNHYRSGEFAMGLGTVPPKSRPAMLWLYDKWFGSAGDETFDVFLPHHAIFALKDYPAEVETGDPADVLPRVWEDAKKGLYVFRNRWADGEDFVACFDMNLKPGDGAGKPVCTGGFKIVGLGGRWAVGGPSVKHRNGQNVVVTADMHEKGAGQRTFFEGRPDGSGVAAVSLRRVHGTGRGADRSFAVDFSGESGAPGLFAVTDRLAGRDIVWTMFSMEPATAVDNTFTIEGPDGATMRGTFVWPGDVQVAVHPDTVVMKTPERAKDQTHEVCRIEARSARSTRSMSSGEFFVVMTVQKGAPPGVKTTGKGMKTRVRVGPQTVRFDGKKLVLGR
jgi:hypothetical protein